MQNIHGKEIDLLRTTVKVPGKRLPRAAPATAPGTSPRANGLALERSNTQLGGGPGEVMLRWGACGKHCLLFWKSGECCVRHGPREGVKGLCFFWDRSLEPQTCCRNNPIKCICGNASLMEIEVAAEV